MTSLARHIVLRSTGPHRNISLVFRGQLRRHIHETAEKPPVFRWEVRRFGFLMGKIKLEISFYF